MNIAIIPARGNSRRIPNKNIKKFNGKPIIFWSIKCALKTKLFDKIIVSTDDKKIAKLSKKYGAEVPFMRPESLAKDTVGVIDVVSHATSWILKKGIEAKYICCIFATSPLMKHKDICLGYKKLMKKKWTYVFSATTFPSSVYGSFFFNKNRSLKMCFPNKLRKKIGKHSDLFYDAGQFYWGEKEAWLKKKEIFKSHSTTIEIPRWRVQDINFKKDWITAQQLFKVRNNEK